MPHLVNMTVFSLFVFALEHSYQDKKITSCFKSSQSVLPMQVNVRFQFKKREQTQEHHIIKH